MTVPAGQTVPVNVMDVYLQRTAEQFPDVAQPPSGSLKVTKTIAGPSAGQQGPVAMNVACGGGPLHTFAFRIPADTGRGSVSRVFPNLPVGARCTVTETADGHTATVDVVATRRREATIPVNGRATVHLTDTYSPRAAPNSGLG